MADQYFIMYDKPNILGEALFYFMYEGESRYNSAALDTFFWICEGN